MLQVTTETGSKYQIDNDNLRARRCSGEKAPTKRMGSDGAWRSLTEKVNPIAGRECILIWDYINGVAKTTITSRVVEVEEVPQLDDDGSSESFIPAPAERVCIGYAS